MHARTPSTTVQHGMAKHGTAQRGTARHGAARHSTARHGMTRDGHVQVLGDVLFRKYVVLFDLSSLRLPVVGIAKQNKSQKTTSHRV